MVLIRKEKVDNLVSNLGVNIHHYIVKKDLDELATTNGTFMGNN